MNIVSQTMFAKRQMLSLRTQRFKEQSDIKKKKAQESCELSQSSGQCDNVDTSVDVSDLVQRFIKYSRKKSELHP